MDIRGKEYAFDAPATVRGGLVEVSFANVGREPHFAGFARVAEGKTFADAKAALTSLSAPLPPGPPPFEELLETATVDPGGPNSKITFNLPAGTYALYCLFPAADGAPHTTKGMISEITVTEGPEGKLPASVGTVTATDFAFDPLPSLKAGTNVVRLRNAGKQLHSLGLVELAPGKKVEDVTAWFQQLAGSTPETYARVLASGPPPMRNVGGVVTKPGEEATTELELKAGSTYAFICGMPDVLGDLALHVTKGMHTQEFTVS